MRTCQPRVLRDAVVLLIALLAVVRGAEGQITPLTAASGKPAIIAMVDAALAEPQLRGGVQAIVIQSLANGDLWYARNGDLLMVPASNQKLLTTAAALHVLGPDYRYRTRAMVRQGAISGGVLRGDLYLKGSGDPFLDEAGLKTLAERIKRSGVRTITGRVVGDGTIFTSPRYGYGWSWDDMPYYYSAPISGLNLNRNLLQVFVTPGKALDAPASVRISPTSAISRVRSRVRTAAKGVRSRVEVDRDLGVDLIEVSGHIAVNAGEADRKPIAVTVENAPIYAAQRLVELLRNAGLRVQGGAVVGRTPAHRVIEIAHFESEPMSRVIALVNKPSDNLGAECLLRTIGAERGGEGSVPAGRAAVMKWFTEIGMDPDGLVMQDGSGLSRMDFLTANNLVKLLRHVRRGNGSDDYVKSLPVAGVDGTLRNRLKGTRAADNCRAKTGYVSNVSTISGYVTTAGGEELVFSILMNNHRCRNIVATTVQDQIIRSLAEYVGPE